MFGLPGGKSWECQFRRHSPFLNNIVIHLADKMIKESLIREIDAMIEEKLKGKDYTDEEIRSAIKAWYTNKAEEIPRHVSVLGINISFDMGW